VGTHTLKYVFTTNVGCKDSATQNITVWPSPVAQFRVAAPTCETRPVTLIDSSQANFSKISTWKWNFGNGATDTRTSGAPFQVTYASTGNFTVQLQVITDSGCTSQTLSKSVKINPLALVDFDLPVVCMPGGAAKFTNRSTIADGSQAQMSYLWNFGESGATSTLKDPVHNYSAVGQYSVSLEATSKDGCQQTATKLLTDVNPQPLANFELLPPSVCLGAEIKMEDRSNPLSQTITAWKWDFGNGTSSTQQNTSQTYSQAGSYNVRLYYTTSKGCVSDTVTKIATVHPFPVVNAGPDQVVLESGQLTIPATVSGSSNYQFLWSPATYLNNPALLQPVSSPLADISYTLTVTGAGGCQSSDNVNIKLLLAPEVPNAFSPNGDAINDVWTIKYLDSYPGAEVQLFDRYGRIVFASTGYNKPWDGKNKGVDVPVGVYYYIIDPKNGRKAMSGSVTVIR
jgi:gliding motility-associated-like protein